MTRSQSFIVFIEGRRSVEGGGEGGGEGGSKVNVGGGWWVGGIR